MVTEKSSGYQPDPSLQPAKGVIDMAKYLTGSQQELWLVQLPKDFPTDSKIEWKVTPRNGAAVEATASVSGRTYKMETDPSAQRLYVPPSKTDGKAIRISRSLSVRRVTKTHRDICGATGLESGFEKRSTEREPHQQESKRAKKENDSHGKKKKEKKEERKERKEDKKERKEERKEDKKEKKEKKDKKKEKKQKA